MSLLNTCHIFAHVYIFKFVLRVRQERNFPTLSKIRYKFLLVNFYVYMIICLINIFLLGSGYYMYIEASSGSTGYKSDLVSKLLSPKHVLCMELWYNMYGSTMGSIDVYIKVNVQTIRKHVYAIYCDFSRL